MVKKAKRFFATLPLPHTLTTSLTANEHDAYGEDLLRVGVGGDVAEAHAGQAAEGKVESRNILVLGRRARGQVSVIVLFADLLCQVVQPADLHASNSGRAGAFHVAYGIPNTGQPVGDQGKGAHEEEEDRGAVL